MTRMAITESTRGGVGAADGGGAETTRAAYVTALGPAGNIRVGELPVPPTGPGEVLVRTEAVVVNHVDTFVRAGSYRTPTPFPFVVGRDLVGTVLATGEGTTGFAPGDRVWCNSLGHGGRQGSFAGHVVVAADRLYPLPPGVGAEDAVACVHPAATAHLGLTRAARLGPGTTVAVGGAAGAVGSAAVQLAVAGGARVLATARPADADWCRENGAAEVFDYRDPDVAGRIRAAAPGGVDVYWDTSGRGDLGAAVPVLARGGCLLLTAGGRRAVELPVGAFYLRDARLYGFVISNASVAELATAAVAVNDMLARGRLRVRVGEVLPLERAAEAHRRVEEGGTRGRLVLRV